MSASSANPPGIGPRTNLITHDQQLAFNRADVAPPDTQLAAGPTSTLEVVNVMGEIRDRGTGQKTDFDLNTFFNVPQGFFFSDPKVIYDAAKGRWYLSGLAFDGATPSTFDSYVFLAASTTSNPSGTWVTYVVLDQHTQHILCDQPHLGFSDDKVVIACDEFAFINSQPMFTNDVWLVVDKSGLLSGSSSVAEYLRSYTDNNHFSIQPAYSMTATTTQYMVFEPPGAGLGGLIAVTGNPAAGNVSWFEANLLIASVSLPPRAPQQGSASTIDTGDLRFDSAVFSAGVLWTGGGDACIPAGDSVQRSCLRLVQANVSGWPFTRTPTVSQDFDLGMFVAGHGDYLYYPAIAMDASGTTYVAYSESSATDFTSVLASDILPGAPGAVDQTFLVQAGNGPYVGPASALGGSRWGDYSAAAPDPLDAHSVWVTGEMAAFESSHLSDWGTVTATFSVPSCSSAQISTTAPQPAPAGPTVVFTGSSIGCWGTPQYQFRKLSPNASWTIVQAYSASSTFSWDTSNEGVGTYRFELDVRSQGFVNAFDATSTVSFDLVVGCGSVTMTVSPASPAPIGTTVTMSATASGSSCASPQYRFWIRPAGGSWAIVQDYSSSSNFNWTPVAAGGYSLSVHARARGASAAYESLAGMPYTVTLAMCRSVTASAAPASPQPVGTTVTITATTTGCPNPRYEFWIRAPGGSWTVAQGYSVSAAFSWNTTSLPGGTYYFSVWARDSGSAASYDAFAPGAPYMLTTTACTSVTVSAAPASPQDSGTAVTITANAATCPNARYQFWILPPGGTWAVAQAYSSTATFSWNTTGSVAGSYRYSVWTRDSSSAATYDTFFPGTVYTLTSTPCTSVGASASPASPQAHGTTITFTATSAGCSHPLYELWVKIPGGSWTVVQAYSTNATFSWNTTGLPAGTYFYSVWVRDSGSAAGYDKYVPGTAYTLT